jgi:hypothetical protein
MPSPVPFSASSTTSIGEDSRRHPFASKPETLLWRPLSLKSLPSKLDQTGWSLRTCVDISEHYETWYSDLVSRFIVRRPWLLERFASDLVAYAQDYYCSLLEAIKAGALGGAIVYAQAKSHPTTGLKTIRSKLP